MDILQITNEINLNAFNMMLLSEDCSIEVARLFAGRVWQSESRKCQIMHSALGTVSVLF